MNRFCLPKHLPAALLMATALPCCGAEPAAVVPTLGLLPQAGCSTEPLKGKREFAVGPGQRYAELEKVPWLSLRAGDVVNIYYRPEPYRTKLVISAQGTARAPVVINGVTDADCHRPEITGENAVPSDDVVRNRYFNQWTEPLATILIWGPWGQKPSFIELRNLRITGGRANVTYHTQDGKTAQFGNGSAGVHAATVEDLLIENCDVTGNGNGIFVNTKNDSEQEASRRVTLRRNLVYLNGNPGSWLEHNLYVQAARVVYEGNYIGQLVPGAVGSSLKDRSSGTIVRYNYIVAAARALDLVESEGGSTSVMVDPEYNDAWVYGNVIVSDHDNPGVSSSKLIHWGGDNSPKLFRTGTLHFYYNTVVTRADHAQVWRLHVFDLPSDQQQVEMLGNVFWHIGSASYELGEDAGRLHFIGTNWISRGWAKGHDGGNTVTVTNDGKLIEGDNPGLGAGFVPLAGSPLIDAGGGAPAELAQRWVEQQPDGRGGMAPRKVTGAALDLGAMERP